MDARVTLFPSSSPAVNVAAIVAAFAAIAAGFSLASRSAETVPAKTSVSEESVKPRLAHGEEKKSTKRSGSGHPNVARYSELYSVSAYASAHSVPSVADILTERDRWSREALAGNGRASFALFRVSMARINSKGKQENEEPFKWLKLAASQGDLEAKYVLALNSNPSISRTFISGASNDEIAQARTESEKALVELAQQGVEEAIRALIAGYDEGWFGTPDPVAGASYASALAQLQPTTSNLRQAEARAFALKTFDRGVAAARTAKILLSYQNM